jgi:hypothetical protein
MARNDAQRYTSEANAIRNDAHPVAAMAVTVAGVGLILGLAGAWRKRRQPGRFRDSRDRRDALVTYLLDHLSGSDTAIQTVERLRRTHAGTAAGRLFGSLFAEFQRERDVVRAMLRELGASSYAVKRAATLLGGRLLAQTANGQQGDLALFRTLEALAVGVQGKRCLWRAAQELKPGLHAATHGRLRELEQTAVRQWEAIEQQRRALAPQTFATVKGATSPMAS